MRTFGEWQNEVMSKKPLISDGLHKATLTNTQAYENVQTLLIKRVYLALIGILKNRTVLDSITSDRAPGGQIPNCRPEFKSSEFLHVISKSFAEASGYRP